MGLTCSQGGWKCDFTSLFSYIGWCAVACKTHITKAEYEILYIVKSNEAVKLQSKFIEQ